MSARIFWIVTAVNVLIFPFIVFNLFLIHSKQAIKPYVIVSGSMEPFIPTGSLIYTIKKNEYSIGDVVTFVAGNEFITHRIVKELVIGRERYFSTKGDANGFTDFDLVHEESIIGSITTILPSVGKIVEFYKTPQGLLLGTLVSLVIVLMPLKSKLKSAVEIERL